MYDLALGIIICLLFIGLVILFCFVVIKLYIKKIKEHDLKEIAFQKTLTATVIETQEQVLNNISQDLHDDAGQQLTSINFQLENLKLDSPDLEEILTPISKSVALLSQSIRGVSHSLNNQIILQKDLIKVIEDDLKRLKKNRKIRVEFNAETKEVRSFSESERIFIYRIFQECINNCLKHSKCRNLEVKIKTSPHFQMIFSDNGLGFDPNTTNASLGLKNMKARAEAINYLFTIESAIGEGTRIILSENKTV